MKSPFLFLVTAVLLLTGCNQPAESDSVSGGGGTIEAINHTHWAINHFSVNGQSGVDIIGPWQGGGGAGYFGVPSKWEHGMTVITRLRIRLRWRSLKYAQNKCRAARAGLAPCDTWQGSESVFSHYPLSKGMLNEISLFLFSYSGIAFNGL
ncbi:MAG: DUF3304 domain-containing protein [Klebsiella variicola]|nr:DUF3304 domain-containing protein [Klebsiella variicola]